MRPVGEMWACFYCEEVWIRIERRQKIRAEPTWWLVPELGGGADATEEEATSPGLLILLSLASMFVYFRRDNFISLSLLVFADKDHRNSLWSTGLVLQRLFNCVWSIARHVFWVY